jgi:hypothetical protein
MVSSYSNMVSTRYFTPYRLICISLMSLQQAQLLHHEQRLLGDIPSFGMVCVTVSPVCSEHSHQIVHQCDQATRSCVYRVVYAVVIMYDERLSICWSLRPLLMTVVAQCAFWMLTKELGQSQAT